MRTLRIKFLLFIKRSRKIFLLLFFIVINGCSSSAQFTLFYSGNINGVYENCRCPKVSEGSILNHITFQKDSIDTCYEAINVSTGNYFSMNPSDRENLLLKDILDSLDYHVFSPGRNDLEFIREIKNIAVVSCNIVDFLPFKRFEINGLAVTVTGMTDFGYSRFNTKNTITEKTISQISDFTDSLRTFSDIIIFISNLENEFEKRVFNQVKNIDIMVSGINRNNEMFQFGSKIYLSTGSSAEYIGKLKVEKKKDLIYYKNKFTQMKFNIIKEHQSTKLLLDSLKIKYGIKNGRESIQEDL